MEPGFSNFESKCREYGLDPATTSPDALIEIMATLQRARLRLSEANAADRVRLVRPRVFLHAWQRPGHRFVPPRKQPVMR